MIFSIGHGPHENGKITMNLRRPHAAKRRERSGGTVTLCVRVPKSYSPGGPLVPPSSMRFPRPCLVPEKSSPRLEP